MKHALRPHFKSVVAVFFALVMACGQAVASYESPLPVKLSTDPDLCAYVPCAEVLPGTDSFSLRKGKPAYVEAYKDGPGGQLLGYVFLSTDIVDIPAYSGKPIVTLIGMDTQGIIRGIKILRHSEPILLVGIPEGELTKFIDQYLGKFVGDKIDIGQVAEGDGHIGLDAISGATVTVIAENQVVMRSGYLIAKQLGIVQSTPRPQAVFDPAAATRDWASLVKEGSVGHIYVSGADIGEDTAGQPYMDMHFGYLNAPAIGRSILGERNYQRLMADLKPNEHAIFIIANGAASFKGSGFVRGGIFDRIQVAQELDAYTFHDVDYLNLYSIEAAGAPAFGESGIFILRGEAFSAAYPWNLVFLANHLDNQTGARTFINFGSEYWLADRHLQGGRPNYERPAPLWVKIWKSRAVDIGFFSLFLFSAGLTYALRDKLVRRATRKDKRWVSIPKHLLWITSVGYVGFYLMAQPSITQVLTWFHSILFKWQWDLFLTDPFIFLFWIFIIVSTFFWGRGMFCGWLCPYGSMSELIYNAARKLGLKRYQRNLPAWLHERLKWLKYVIFAGLLGMSFYSMGMAERLAEVEPFKTTFLVGVWNRSWPFVTFWLVLFIAALFIERPFCKYLCPLGAGLAVPSTFRWWGLKRKAECGPCDACAVGCGSLAIDSKGRIDQRECLLCLDCMILYYDPKSCPPLSKERKLRLRHEQPLTAIGGNGYYIPIIPVATTPAVATEARLSGLAWLRAELLDHLFPWSGKILSRPLFIQASGLALAILMTWVWLLGAAGKLGTGIILGWWLAWSAYELVVRMHCKPYVKEGPWWGRHFRPASWADMLAYVGMKNLLIGAALFLVMHGIGALDFLRALPELKWLY